jgi:predicted phosphodiesterase
MKLGIISDIHGNLVSLERVLAALEKDNVDQLICLGDVAASGPQPRDCVERLQAIGCPVVMGNTDVYLLDPQPYEGDDERLRIISDLDSWCHEQLSEENLAFVRSFRPVIDHPLDENTSLLCFHGSPKANTDIILATTPEEDLAQMLEGDEANFMAGGHTHTQLLRRYKDVLLFNPGSVGLPFEYLRSSGQVRNPPWAEYALLTWAGDSFDLAFRRVSVDVEAVMATAHQSGMPHAAWWTQHWG